MENLPKDTDFELKAWLSSEDNQVCKVKAGYYDNLLILAEALNASQGDDHPTIQKKRNKVLDSEPKLACHQCVLI